MKIIINAYHDDRDNEIIQKRIEDGLKFIGKDNEGDLIFEKKLTCPVCKKEFDDEDNIDAVENLNMCLLCDHVAGDVYSGKEDESYED